MYPTQNKGTYVKRVNFRDNILSVDKFIKEARVATMMSDNNIGPRVYNYRIYKTYGEISMVICMNSGRLLTRRLGIA